MAVFNALTIADELKYANLQMAAEALFGFDATLLNANLLPGDIRTNQPIAESSLTTGNLHSSKFTARPIGSASEKHVGQTDAPRGNQATNTFEINSTNFYWA